MTSHIDDCPHKPTQVFPACFVLTHMLPEKTYQGVTHPSVIPDQARLPLEFTNLWKYSHSKHYMGGSINMTSQIND